jgi:hypothetical protein
MFFPQLLLQKTIKNNRPFWLRAAKMDAELVIHLWRIDISPQLDRAATMSGIECRTTFYILSPFFVLI